MDRKGKSTGEEVKSQVPCLLSGQEQGAQEAGLHRAQEKTYVEA